MNRPYSHRLLLLALFTQLLSPVASAFEINAGGVWSVSCSGKAMLLPLGTDENHQHSSACWLCCDEPRKGTTLASAFVLPASADPVIPAGLPVAFAATSTHRVISHPTRAPPFSNSKN